VYQLAAFLPYTGFAEVPSSSRHSSLLDDDTVFSLRQHYEQSQEVPLGIEDTTD
jgi:hypothetical protein